MNARNGRFRKSEKVDISKLELCRGHEKAFWRTEKTFVPFAGGCSLSKGFEGTVMSGLFPYGSHLRGRFPIHSVTVIRTVPTITKDLHQSSNGYCNGRCIAQQTG